MKVLNLDVEVLVVSKHLFSPQGILGHVVTLLEPTLVVTILSFIYIDKVVEFWMLWLRMWMQWWEFER